MEIRERNVFGGLAEEFTSSPKTEQMLQKMESLGANGDALTDVQMFVAEVFELQMEHMLETQMTFAEIYELMAP